jgi:hypothetical protein
MHRFVASIKRFTMAKETKTMICFAFSLLLNSTDLPSISEHFQHICVFFLSEYETALFIESKAYISKLLNERPSSGESLQDLVNGLQLFSEPEVASTNNNDTSTHINNTLKAKSPFTSVFVSIKNTAVDNLADQCDDTEKLLKNKFYCPEIIEFLLDQYMPYCFVWASFALKDYGVTRMSNGLIEKYNQYRKGGDLKLARPCIYLEKVVEGVEAHAFRYLEEIRNHPEVVAAAAVKQAKADKLEIEREQLANVNDEHQCVDVFYKTRCGLPKPSFQSQVPMCKLEALTSQTTAKPLLNINSKRTSRGCEICNIGKNNNLIIE